MNGIVVIIILIESAFYGKEKTNVGLKLNGVKLNFWVWF